MGEYDQQFGDLDQSLDAVAHRLDRQGADIAAVLTQASAHHRSLGDHLTEISEGQSSLERQLGQLNRDFDAFTERHRRDLERLMAQVGLVDLRAQIQREYGPYEDVRRTMRGILDIWESGLAHDATLQHIAEKKGIDAPGYWLAAVLNATVSWVRKDQVTMEAALLKAMSQDIGKTALFAGLLNARYRRFEATENWFRPYLRDQDPQELTDAFVVVLDSAMLGVLGPATYDLINTKCLTWFDQLSSRPELVAVQVDRWERFIARHTTHDARSQDDFSRRYQGLIQVDSSWREAAGALHQATAFGHAAQILRPITGADKTDPEERLHGVDRVLRRLSELPEPGERELRSKEFDLKRLMDPDGDEETLADLRKAEATLNEPTIGFLDLITNMVMHPERFDVAPRTTQLATHLARDWICEATVNLRTQSAAAMPEVVTALIDNWKGDIGRGIDRDVVTADLERKMDENTDYDETKERRVMQRVGFVAIATACLALWLISILSGTALNSLESLIMVGLAVVCGAVAVGIHVDTPLRLQGIRAQGKRRKTEAVAKLRAAISDQAALVQRWRDLLKEADDLQEKVRAVKSPDIFEDAAGISTWPDDERTGTVARLQSQALTFLPSWDLKPKGW